MQSYIKQGDCLELMKEIPDGSVDMVLCDLPYGVLNRQKAKWDSPIEMKALWKEWERVVKDKGAIVLFGQGMFTANTIFSAPNLWRYNLVWKKGKRCSGFLNANRQPLRNHEDIMVFCSGQTTYNPQMVKCEPHERNHSRGKLSGGGTNRCYGSFTDLPTRISDEKYPRSVLDYSQDFPPVHPTQKPVALLEYLIKTYTNEGELVLDNCMGSGSTCVAAINTERRYIGFELEPEYFEIAERRIERAKAK